MQNEENIKELVREYEANKLLKPFLIDDDIFKQMAKEFHVAIKKDVNGYCVNCHTEPCNCHLIATV